MTMSRFRQAVSKPSDGVVARFWPIFPALLTLVLLLVAACGDGSSTGGQIPGATPTGVPTTLPSERNTPEIVDRAIASVNVNNGDRAALAALIEPQRIACMNVEGLGGPPDCRAAPGTPSEGTIVEAFPYGTCEREWQFDLTAFAERFLNGAGTLYAVVSIETYTPQEELPDGGYGIIYTNADSRLETAHALVVTEDGIVAAHSLCGGTPATFLVDQPPFHAPDVILEGPAFE